MLTSYVAWRGRGPSAAGVAYREGRPTVGQTFEFVTAAVGERNSGPQHQRRDHARNHDFAGPRERHDARRDVRRDAMDVAVGHLHLAQPVRARGITVAAERGKRFLATPSAL
jgi:hypothetical protein